MSFFLKVPEIKKKSSCLKDSKHIFKLKIVQVFPKKNWFKKARDLLSFCTVKCTQRPRRQKGRGPYYRDRYIARLGLLALPPCFHFLPSLHRAHVATCNVISSPKTVAKERVKE
jgi:hypothetical protein